MSIWKKIRHRLEWLGLQWLYFAIPLLPRGLAHALGKLLGTLAYHLDARGRRTAIENLTLVFGREKNESEIRRLARDSYRSFAQTVIDQFWGSRLNERNYTRYCELWAEDMDAIERARENGAIWVTPHYSNFEWIALIMGFRGYKFTIVAQDFRNPSLTETYKKNRERSGHEVIPQRGAIIRLLKNLKRGGHAAFLTDLTIKPSKAATLIDCFGIKTSVTAIHAELMKRTGLPVIPGSASRGRTAPTSSRDSSRSSSDRMTPSRPWPRPAGISSRNTSMTTPLPGCGCTNTGASPRPMAGAVIPPMHGARRSLTRHWRGSGGTHRRARSVRREPNSPRTTGSPSSQPWNPANPP